MRLLHRLGLAASCVTSFPFVKQAVSEEELHGLSKYLPSVGLLIGCSLCIVYLLCESLRAEANLKAVMITLSWLAITGCIHLDGLMDTADGIFSQQSRERMLEIMKDSRVGNFGAICGFMLLVTKISSIACLPAGWILPSLLLVPSLARWTEVFVISAYPYAREQGMGKIWHDSCRRRDLLTAAIAPSISLYAICAWQHSYDFSLLFPITVLPGILFSSRINRILSGQTGDTYGAAVEFSEAASLLLLALITRLF